MSTGSGSVADPPRRKGFFPHRTVPGWLAPDLADALLDKAIRSEGRYDAGSVYTEGDRKIDREIRDVERLSTLGAFDDALRQQALAIKPELESALGTPRFEPKSVEIELASYGDGAHFDLHIDTFIAIKRPSRRILTLVLYLHRRPARFTGGALRLYSLDRSTTIDIAPEHNLLVAFPSMAPHSIERVSVPSGAFADRRFAINIWIGG